MAEVPAPCSEAPAGDLRAAAWILRFGVAGCFIGHGAFGVITKSAWLPYFGVAGIPPEIAWKLMPWVGGMDIALGLTALFWPTRALLGWAVVWCAWTALLRPLSGESVWEFFERGGNYGAPLAWLMAVGLAGGWWTRLPRAWPSLGRAALARVRLALRCGTAALLAGHAGFGVFLHKAVLAGHLHTLGVPEPARFVPALGALEFVLALLVLFRPGRALLLAVFAWKIANELLYPMSGSPVWEFVERFGSYALPLALALLLPSRRRIRSLWSESPLEPALETTR